MNILKKRTIRKVLFISIVLLFSLIFQSSICSNLISNQNTNDINLDKVNEVILKHKYTSFEYKQYYSITDKHYYEINSVDDLRKYIDLNDAQNEYFKKYNNDYFSSNTLIVYPIIDTDNYDYIEAEENDSIITIVRKIYNDVEYENNQKIYVTMLFEYRGKIKNHYDFNIRIKDVVFYNR